MPIVLILGGLALLWLDYLGSNNLKSAGSLLHDELFGGTSPFYKWAGAIILIGLIGYVPELRKFSVSLLALVILSIVLAHKGAATNLEKAL